MTKINIIKNRLINKAKQSRCKFRVSAMGFNRNGTCVAARTNIPLFSRKGGGIHAESRIMALSKQKGITKILICRIGNRGNLLPIDPCATCKKTAKKLGIKIETIKE